MGKQVEMILDWAESGSNAFSVYQTLLSAIKGKTDQYTFVKGAVGIATITNVIPILQPIRIQTNTLAATTVLLKIVVDWNDEKKNVDSGDVLTLISSAGATIGTVAMLSAVAPELAVAAFGIATVSDLISYAAPYMPSRQAWAGMLSSMLPTNVPVSADSSSLYWARPGGRNVNRILCTYDEITSNNGLFVYYKGVSGTTAYVADLCPIPGSFAPVNESAYIKQYCEALPDTLPGSDRTSVIYYCENNGDYFSQ